MPGQTGDGVGLILRISRITPAGAGTPAEVAVAVVGEAADRRLVVLCGQVTLGGSPKTGRGDEAGKVRPSDFGASERERGDVHDALGAFVRTTAELPAAEAQDLLAGHGLDEWSRDNLLAYLTEQREHAHLSDDRTIVLERFRDEIGDWRLVIHSPFGARVHTPWALVLGARWVQARPDPALSAAAKNALGKIATASPEDLRDRISNTGLWPVRTWWDVEEQPLLGVLREAIRDERVLDIDYGDEHGQGTQRQIWPVALAYYEEKQIVAAWCTMRDDFRNFRVDRILSARPADGRFGKRRAVLAREWEDSWRTERQARHPNGG